MSSIHKVQAKMAEDAASIVVNQSSIDNKEMSEEKARDLRAKKEAPKFKYKFTNMEQPGKSLSFFFGEARRPEKFHWQHGEIVEVREEIAEHVQSKQTPIYKWVDTVNQDGSPRRVARIVSYTPRFIMQRMKG